jgi:hypothetical protein
MNKNLLALGAVLVGGTIAALVRSKGRAPSRRPRPSLRLRIMARMLEGMPPEAPPKLVMSILPRLREQNEEIITLLREQSELLRRGQPEPVSR